MDASPRNGNIDRPPRRFPPLEILVLALLAARLLAWAFLLPPWNGFDEPFHQGYVETCAEAPGWHAFESAKLPARLIEGMRAWPLYSGYAEQFGARSYGDASPHPVPPTVAGGNYEMLQSPAYYVAAGYLLRLFPALPAIAELYLLRCVNALLAFFVGLLTLHAARRNGFERRSWMAPAVLAFVPGFTLGLVRVSNDALCALLMTIAVGLSLSRADGSARRPVAAAAAAGFAPWAKLYGLAALPALAIDALRSGEKNRVLRFVLLLLPPAALAYFSRRINGSAVSLLEILSRPKPVRLLDVPWLRDVWTIGKTHLWVSGMSALVFSSAIYAALIAGLASCVYLTMREVAGSGNPESRRNLFQIGAPILFFLVALGYLAWKNFERFREPGGVGGWYLWSLALPEALLLTWGISRRPGSVGPTVLFGAFLLLTAAGDLVFFSEVSGRLTTGAGNRHVRGIAGARLTDLVPAFFHSRPAGAAWTAITFAGLSWLLGLVVLASGARQGASPETSRS